jgi:hypothetical protein
MGRGIIGLVQLAATVAFAAPVALFGLLKLSEGDTVIGGALLAVAAGMIAVEEYLVTPKDVPGMVAEEAVDRVVKDTDADEE